MDWNFEMKVLEARSKMKLKHCKNKKINYCFDDDNK